MSDETISTAQIRAARGLLAWSQSHLAQISGASEAEVARTEASDGDAPRHTNIVAALMAAGVLFLSEDDGMGAGVRLSRPRFAPREIAIGDLNSSNDE